MGRNEGKYCYYSMRNQNISDLSMMFEVVLEDVQNDGMLRPSYILRGKTATLTEGKPKVSETRAINVAKEELLSITLTLEDYSTHSIAKSIVSYLTEKGIQPKNGELFKSIVGKGVQATMKGDIFYVGKLKLFEEMNLSLKNVKNQVEELQSKGKTVVIIGTKNQVIGIISVSDPLRETSTSALKALKQNGVNQTVMLTGENEGTAKMIASEAKINRYFAELLPDDKLVLIFPGLLTLWMAVLSDTGAALLVILNTIRLLKYKE